MEKKPKNSIITAAYVFACKKEKFNKISKLFEKEKKAFYATMDSYFSSLPDTESTVIFEPTLSDITVEVTKVQKTNVIFDANKVEKALGKKLSRDVIIKRCEVIDIESLVDYLKSCDVDPQIFKSFISITKIVDVNELDRLEEVGKITTEQLDGCYEVKNQNPYYTVKMGKATGESD